MARDGILIAEQVEALTKGRELPQALGEPKRTLLAIDDQTIDFRAVEGRVYHKGVEFHVGDVLVRSRGSVGFDETLAIELDIPIRDEWTERAVWLRGLRGQSLKIQVGGTFSRPQIDRRALRDLTRQLVRSAAQGAIEEQVGGLLDQLLRPKE